MKKSSGYLKMKWPDTVKGWQATWFYYFEPSTVVDWHIGWSLKLIRVEHTLAKILMEQIGLTSNDIIAAWVSRRIQPL